MPLLQFLGKKIDENCNSKNVQSFDACLAILYSPADVPKHATELSCILDFWQVRYLVHHLEAIRPRPRLLDRNAFCPLTPPHACHPPLRRPLPPSHSLCWGDRTKGPRTSLNHPTTLIAPPAAAKVQIECMTCVSAPAS